MGNWKTRTKFYTKSYKKRPTQGNERHKNIKENELQENAL